MKIVFMGTPDFAVPALHRLSEEFDVVAVYTQPDKPVGRGLKVQASPVKKVAIEKGIPVFTPEKISTDEEVARLKEFNADFIVVVAYGQILKSSVIDLPKYQTLNIHSSLLPRWRGAAPIHWAVLSGDSKTGVSTMVIVPKLDAGDVLLRAETEIAQEDTVTSVHDRLSKMGGDLIVNTIHGLVSGEITPKPQDESKVTYAHKLTKEMAQLDFSSPAREVDLRVRALNPWPGTSVETVGGSVIKIKSGKPMGEKANSNFGTLDVNVEGLVLVCARGEYVIHELQEQGRKSVQAHDFVNALKSRGQAFPIQLKGKS